MPFNGSGGFDPLPAPIYPAIPDTTILSDQYNLSLADVFAGLGQVITRDGQSPATANLPMGGFKHTGAGAATVAGQYLTYGQTAPIVLTAGTAALPSLAFAGDPNTGLWSPAADTQAWSTGGVERLRLADTLLSASVPIRTSSEFQAANGTAAAPSILFTSDPDTGIYRVGTNTVGIASAGGEAAAFSLSAARFLGATQGALGVIDGAASGQTADLQQAAFVIDASTNTGISILTPNTSVGAIAFGDTDSNITGQIRYTHSTDVLDFVVAGVARLTLDAPNALSSVVGDLTSSGIASFGGAIFDNNVALTARGNATPNSADVTGGRGTLYLSGWGSATPGNGVLGTAIAFSGVATTHRKAMIAAYQDGATQGVTGLGFYIDGSGSLTNEALTLAAEITSAGRLNLVLGSGSLRLNNLITRFESAEQTCPNAATVISVAHGGTRVPDVVYCVLRCKTAEAGYAVGDEVAFPLQQENVSRDALVAGNATNVYLRYDGAGVTPAIRNLGTSTYTALAQANWRVVFKCHWL